MTNISSVLPGSLVQALITAIQPTGLNLQVLGFFEGTVDQLHMQRPSSDKSIKVGKKVKARVLYDISSTPPRFALTLAEHVTTLHQKQIKTGEGSHLRTIQEAHPVGKILEAVKILRLEPERGLFVEVEPGLEGFVHVGGVSGYHTLSFELISHTRFPIYLMSTFLLFPLPVRGKSIPYIGLA